MNNENNFPKRPRRRSALRRSIRRDALDEVTLHELLPEKIAEVREKNAGLDIVIADALADQSGGTTLWLAHGPTNSLFVSIAPDYEDGPQVVKICLCSGGTDWDRKQRLRQALEKVARDCQELGTTVKRL